MLTSTAQADLYYFDESMFGMSSDSINVASCLNCTASLKSPQPHRREVVKHEELPVGPSEINSNVTAYKGMWWTNIK